MRGPEITGVTHYPAAWFAGDLPADSRHGLLGVAAPLARWWEGERGERGGWASPAESALATIGLDAASIHVLDPELFGLVARHLGACQGGDGSWLAEPAYAVPGKAGEPRWMRSTSISAALCAWGLATASTRIGVTDPWAGEST